MGYDLFLLCTKQWRKGRVYDRVAVIRLTLCYRANIINLSFYLFFGE